MVHQSDTENIRTFIASDSPRCLGARLSAALHDLAVKRLVEEHMSEWRTAYEGSEYRGPGSTSRRAKTIRSIYDAAAPLPEVVMPPPSKEFLTEIRRIATGAIEASGGHVRLDKL